KDLISTREPLTLPASPAQSLPRTRSGAGTIVLFPTGMQVQNAPRPAPGWRRPGFRTSRTPPSPWRKASRPSADPLQPRRTGSGVALAGAHHGGTQFVAAEIVDGDELGAGGVQVRQPLAFFGA